MNKISPARSLTRKTLAAALLVICLLPAAETLAQPREVPADAIVIRRTVPYPNAVQRPPLTSDQLDTASTRLIDARRGFRPYSTVYEGRAYDGRPTVYIPYEDHTGISRAADRPYSYSQRAPRTSVTQFRNPAARDGRDAERSSPASGRPIVIINPPRRQAQPDAKPKPEPRQIRIHRDKPVLPDRSGAVLITADGTVIEVGE